MKANLITLSQLDKLIEELNKQNYSVETKENGSVEITEFGDIILTYPSFGDFLREIKESIERYEAKVYSFPDKANVMAQHILANKANLESNYG